MYQQFAAVWIGQALKRILVTPAGREMQERTCLVCFDH